MNTGNYIRQIFSRISLGRSLNTLLTSSRYAGLMFLFWYTSITEFFRNERFSLDNFSCKFSGIFLLFNPLKTKFHERKVYSFFNQQPIQVDNILYLSVFIFQKPSACLYKFVNSLYLVFRHKQNITVINFWQIEGFS